jgi:hypothetical protein
VFVLILLYVLRMDKWMTRKRSKNDATIVAREKRRTVGYIESAKQRQDVGGRR